MCTLGSKKNEGRTESYFILFLNHNDHQTRCFNFGLRRIHPNGCKFDLNLNKNKSKTKPYLKNKINTMKSSFSYFNFRPLGSSLIYEKVNTMPFIKKYLFSARHSELVVSQLLTTVLPSALLSFSGRRKYELLLSSRIVHYHVSIRRTRRTWHWISKVTEAFLANQGNRLYKIRL